MGGHEGDGAFAVAVDSAGDAYVGGVTDAIGGNNFPITAGAAQKVFGGTADGFVTKINPTGTAPLIYSTYLGGSGFDSVLGIAIDASGDAYVTGITSSADFPATAGAFQRTFGGGSSDGFITKLAPDGASLVYSSYLGGSGNDIGRAIALDPIGNAYVNGNTSSSDFPKVSPVQAIPAPNGQLVVSRNDGDTFSASGLAPGAGSLNALAVDTSTSPHTVYAGSARNGLYRSTDDGATFNLTALTAPIGPGGIALDPTSGRLYVGNSQGLSVTTDGGISFQSLLFGTPISPLFVNTASEPVELYAGSSAGLLDSTDGGATFSPAGLPAASRVLSIASDPNASPAGLYAGTNQGIFASTDGGVTFRATAMNFQPAFSLAVDSSESPSVLYAGLDIGLIRSTDGFATFTSPVSVINLAVYDLEVDSSITPSRVFAGGQLGDLGYLARSDNSGRTFQLISDNTDYLPAVTRIALDGDAAQGVFAGLFLDFNSAVSQVSSDGSALLFSSLFGGSNEEFGTGIAAAGDSLGRFRGAVRGRRNRLERLPGYLGAAQPNASGPMNAYALQISGLTLPSVPTPTPTATPTPSPTPTPAPRRLHADPHAHIRPRPQLRPQLERRLPHRRRRPRRHPRRLRRQRRPRRRVRRPRRRPLPVRPRPRVQPRRQPLTPTPRPTPTPTPIPTPRGPTATPSPTSTATPTPGPTPVIQDTSCLGTSSCTCTFPKVPVNPHLVVVGCESVGSSRTVVSSISGLGATFVEGTNTETGFVNALDGSQWAGNVGVGNSGNTVSVTMSGTPVIGTACECAEFAGYLSVSDGGESASATGQTSFGTGTVVTSNANDLLTAFGLVTGSTAVTGPANGFTALEGVAATAPGAFDAVSSTGLYSTDWGVSTGGNAIADIGAWVAGTPSPIPTPGPTPTPSPLDIVQFPLEPPVAPWGELLIAAPPGSGAAYKSVRYCSA